MPSNQENVRYSFIGDSSSLRKESQKASGYLKSFHKEAHKVFVGFTGLRLGQVFADAVKNSIGFIENVNLFNVALRESTETGRKFVDTMQELYGMDPGNIMRDVGTFYQLTSAVGATTKASEVMSTQLTKTANDIASLFNIPVDRVVENLQSGMRGMTRAVYKYGIDIRATTLQVTASSLGIHEQVERMSEADREGLRYITMMRQAKNAVGDFAHTIEQPANQLRIFKEQMSQLARAIGNFFLPTLKKVLPYINGFVMAIRIVINYIAMLRKVFDGLEGDDSAAIGIAGSTDALENMSAAMKDAKKRAKELIAPFDELNVISDKASEGGEDSSDLLGMNPEIEKAVTELQYSFEDVKMKANEVRDAILAFFGFTEIDGQLKFIKESFETNLINKFPQWTSTIQATFDNWSSIIAGFKSTWEASVGVFKQIAADIKNAIIEMLGGEDADQKVAEWITSLPDKLQGISDWINEHKEGIAKFIEIFGGLKIASLLVGGLVTKFSKLSPITDALGKGLAATGIPKFAKNLKQLPNLGKMFKDFKVMDGLGNKQAMKASLGALTEAATAMPQAFAGLNGPLLIIGAIVAALATAYATSEDFRKSTNELFGALGSILSTLWNDLLKPILDTLGPIIKDLWYNALLPILETLMAILTDLVKFIAWALPHILEILMPIVEVIIKSVITPIKTAIEVVMATIEMIVDTVKNVIDVIKSIAHGDWKSAWESFKNIFKDIFKGLYKIGYSIINNFWESIKSFVNGAGRIIGTVKGWFTGDNSAAWTVSWSLPSPDEVFMATGGVVNGPTRATIGEGKYPEAVIPLGNSPQLDQMLDKFASKVSDRPVEVKLYIGGKEWDAFTYTASQRGAKIVGATPLGSEVDI